jgi:hypothetical protein
VSGNPLKVEMCSNAAERTTVKRLRLVRCGLVEKSVCFDETDFEYQGEQDGVLVWLTPKGDGLGLFHFVVPPISKPTSTIW